MNIVIPMAGRGSRFKSKFPGIPKWKIECHGKSLLEWSIDSLPIDMANKIIFVALEEHENKYGLKEFLYKKYKNYVSLEIVLIAESTSSQAETVMFAEPYINNSEGLLIYNIDTFFESRTIRDCLGRSDIDGCLGAFNASSKNLSYAKLENGFVVKTAEKEVISSIGLTGLYYFSEPVDFYWSYETEKRCDKGLFKEIYIAPLYNHLIENNKRYVIDLADTVWVLGTPEDLRNFKHHYQKPVPSAISV